MKSLYALALLGTSLLTLTAAAQRPNDWTKMNLKGKPARIESFSINASKEKFGEPVYDTLQLSLTTTYFDTKGRITKITGKESTTHFNYDESNLLVHKTENNNVRGTTFGQILKYELDQKGRILSQTTLVKSQITSMVKYQYNQNGQKVLETYYSSDGDPWMTVNILSFNNQGLPYQTEKKERCILHGAYTVNRKTTLTYHYDIYGNAVSIIETPENYTQTKYEYDDYHNIIKQYDIFKGITTTKMITVYKITYYN